MKEIKINKSNCGKRADKFVLALLPKAGKSFVYKMFRKKNIVLNDKKITGSEILASGDVIKIYFSDETYAKFSEDDGAVDFSRVTLPEVVFEDENILVLNKAKGIFSQPEQGKISVTEQIYAHYEATGFGLPTGFKVGTCNRLDAETTGIIISGKTVQATADINRLIKEHKVKKTYLALVKGRMEKEILLDNKIEKLEGKARISEDGKAAFMRVIPKAYAEILGEVLSLVEVDLSTGRYHQIRVSLADLGYPIIGDKKYGDSELNKKFKKEFNVNSQLLHSYEYEFLGEIADKKYEAFKAEITDEEFLKIRNLFCSVV